LSIAVVSIVAVFTAAAFTVVYAREWRWASVLLRSVLPRSVLLPPVPFVHDIGFNQADQQVTITSAEIA
jgi:hypothetical protein